MDDADDGGVEAAIYQVTMTAPAKLLRLAPIATLALLIGPIIVGLIWTMLPAFGFLPAIGGAGLSLKGWRVLAGAPEFATALRLTITVGLLTTVLAVALATGFCALRAANSKLTRLDRWLAPLLASPHSAMALGFAFLIAPSGWLVRLVSPWATGLDQPPAGLVTLRDPLGISFIAGLLIKEVPYLVLMILAASAQLPVSRTLAAARALGQSGGVAWLKAVFPQIYPQIRLPIFAVLAFSLSAVDVALILAPGSPPPLAVLVTRWFSSYDLTLYFPAAAGATLQLAIALAAVALWYAAEKPFGALGRFWIERGARSRPVAGFLRGLSALTVGFGALGLLSIVIMGVWSVADTWWYPAALPQTFGLRNWAAQADRVAQTAGTTALIGFLAVLISLFLSLACLENEQRSGIRPGPTALWLLYLPLLVPQIAFLFGAQVVLVRLGLDGTLYAVTWAHLIFVLPYVFLSLVDPYRTLDPRYSTSAAALGASPLRIFLAIKLPILARPILVALAVGFAASVGQYLPTLFAGAGRIATLTTEAVTLSSGADRRIIGVFAILQSGLPVLVYGMALAVPLLLFRNRRDLTI